MAFDGITICALKDELKDKLEGRRISKISQPEELELIFTVKGDGGNSRLFISASPSLPLMYLTKTNKTAPLSAPNFCMLLRKHISNGRIAEIKQMGLERVISFKIEHLDELGDFAVKYLIVELMGKHSNVIFCDEDLTILDSIKHVNAFMSSVREVLPGRKYFTPSQEHKFDPYEVTETMMKEDFLRRPVSVKKALISSLTGFSTTAAVDICVKCDVDADAPCASLSFEDKDNIYKSFNNIINTLDTKDYSPVIYMDEGGKPCEFSAYPLTSQKDRLEVKKDSISSMLEDFYKEKNTFNNMQQKSLDLRKHVKNLIEREDKKLMLQKKQLSDTDKMENYRLYGEMLQTYGHGISGEKSITVDNYYDGSKLTIPLDPELGGIENSKKYFDKYAKAKRTKEALSTQIETTENTIEYLAGVLSFLNLAETVEDLDEIRSELKAGGYIKKGSSTGKKKQVKSKPLHFVTPSGFHVYVGKNNYQNEELSLKFATGNDWWFHAKQMPGSHVIIKTEGKEITDDDYLLCAQLAGYYSSGRDSDKLEIDYVQKKHLKKPAGSAPGYVIYHTNYSMVIHPSKDGLLTE
ncbi:MAG: NFACT family protein [Lachnospiraceae bacterium]|nr:NFACT family protein [Lachnospiraceae bacterium]